MDESGEVLVGEVQLQEREINKGIGCLLTWSSHLRSTYGLRCLIAASKVEDKQVICGHRPFPNLAERWAAQELWKGELPPRPEVGFTDSLWKTLGDCLKPEREERPNADTVLRKLDEALRV